MQPFKSIFKKRISFSIIENESNFHHLVLYAFAYAFFEARENKRTAIKFTNLELNFFVRILDSDCADNKKSVEFIFSAQTTDDEDDLKMVYRLIKRG